MSRFKIRTLPSEAALHIYLELVYDSEGNPQLIVVDAAGNRKAYLLRITPKGTLQLADSVDSACGFGLTGVTRTIIIEPTTY